MPATYRTLLFTLLAVFLSHASLIYSQTALQFVPVTPCRVVDTRHAPGPFGGPPIGAGGERDFAIPQSTCSIPYAAAYSLNVTVVPHGGLGYLTVWPTGQTRPVISTLNSLDGRIKANAAIVPSGTNGAVSVYATNTTDVVLDIDGYFVPATTSTLAFFPLTPCRVADTRRSQGPLGGPKLTGGVQRDFPVLSSSCNIPDSAQGYSLNFTAVPTGGLGYLTVWPTGQAKPQVSTLNDLTGTIVANAAIVPAGESGAVSVFASNDTNLVIDIDGYFAPSSSGPENALSLYTLAPCRLLDTRKTMHAFSGTIPVGVLQSGCQVPSAQAYVLNATVVPQNGKPLSYLTLWPDAEGKPLVSTLNALDGAITSNMAIVPTLNGSIDAYATDPTDLVLDIFSYFAPIAPLGVTTAALPSATLTYNYSTAVAATGGVAPYVWSIAAGSLPPGLSLNPSTGAISGMPTMSGPYPFTVQVTDSQSPAATASAPLSIAVSSSLGQPTIITAALPPGKQNQTYNAVLAASGGATPYTWRITAGSLPAGLGLISSTGAITGTPTGGGTANFTVQVADSEMPPATASTAFSVTISAAVPLSVTSTLLPSGVVGRIYSGSLTAVGGTYPYTWAITSGGLPGGLTLNRSTGVITGTPSLAGSSSFTVQVTDAETPPVSASATVGITINPSGGGNSAALTGPFAFYLNGFDSNGAWTLAGSFISDGNGNIVSGALDGNSVTGQPFTCAITGSYFIAANGLNTVTLQGQSYGPVTFAFVLSSSGNGRIIEYDDTTGQGSRGSGVLRKQDATAFSLARLSGGYVYGMTGIDHSGLRFVDAGVFTLATGSISNGACDINDGGVFQTCTFSGSLSAINAQTGRGEATTQSNNGASHEAVYVVSASEFVMEQIDPVTNTPLLVGSVLQQSGTFTKASLNGLAVLYYQDIHSGYTLDQSGAMIGSFDGNGNYNMIVTDEDLAGTITQDPPQQGTYTVAANGAVIFTGGSGVPNGFLSGQNHGFFVGTGSNSIFGTIEPQTGGPFSDSSIAGAYAGGSLSPLDYAYADDKVDAGTANGVIDLNEDDSSHNGIDQRSDIIFNYSIASNGRGTGQAQGDDGASVIYMISPTKFLVLGINADAVVEVYEH